MRLGFYTAETTAVILEEEDTVEFVVKAVAVVLACVNLEVVTDAYFVLSAPVDFLTFCELDLSSFFFADTSFLFS